MSLSTDTTFLSVLADSYLRFVGKPLIPNGMSMSEGAVWLLSFFF